MSDDTHPTPVRAGFKPAAPASTAQPAAPASTAQPAAPASTAQPAAPASTAQPAAPASTAQPAAPASTAQPAAPASTAQPAPAPPLMLAAWHELVTTALLGTERRQVALPTDGSFNSLFAPLAMAEAEQALLSAAALLSQYRRAGRTAVPTDAPLPAPAPADALTNASAQSRYHLTQMLNGQHRELLSEWLNLAQVAQVAAPPPHLAALLDLGNTQPALRGLIAPVLGTRGRWLAEHNPDWQYALQAITSVTALSEAELLDQWEIADRASRMALLRTTRHHMPARARTLLLATWAQEKADDRANFLEVLAHGLSMDDEPLLEATLDDRHKDVRRAAAGLLMRLPESRLAQRLRVRAHSYLVLRKRVMRAPIIEVTLPAGFDSAMQRDGIEQKQQGAFGEKASWLYQIVSAVPPAEWSAHWRSEPAALLAAAAQREWKDLLLSAWLAATIRHRDADWAEALLLPGLLPVTAEVENLIHVLPVTRRERYLTQLMREQAALAPPLLRHCTHAWSEPFGRAVLDYFRAQIIGGSRQPSWVLLTLVKESARYMPVTLANESVKFDWPKEHPAWSNWEVAIDRLLFVLQFRAEMRAGLGLAAGS